MVRSGVVESVHRASLVVLGPDGAIVLALGDVDVPVFPRSSNKPLQAVAMLEAGWRPTDERQLALANFKQQVQVGGCSERRERNKNKNKNKKK